MSIKQYSRNGSLDDTRDHCGALKSPDDLNDFIFEHLAHGPTGFYVSEFPPEFDLRIHAQPSRDQGKRGTCAAFTAAAIKEIQENRDCGFSEWMSPEFIYYHRDNKPASGMYGRNVFQILQRIGSVPEHMYPYSALDTHAPPPTAELYEVAAKYRIANYARVTTVDGLKRALLELGPCYLQLPLYQTRPCFWIGAEGEKYNGGHAVAVVGFNKEGFILKNSWGKRWNIDGSIIFPYSDWGLQWECWVSVDEKTDTRGVNNTDSTVNTVNTVSTVNTVNTQQIVPTNNEPSTPSVTPVVIPTVTPSVVINTHDDAVPSTLSKLLAVDTTPTVNSENVSVDNVNVVNTVNNANTVNNVNNVNTQQVNPNPPIINQSIPLDDSVSVESSSDYDDYENKTKNKKRKHRGKCSII